jgi:hypothetical protein
MDDFANVEKVIEENNDHLENIFDYLGQLEQQTSQNEEQTQNSQNE